MPTLIKRSNGTDHAISCRKWVSTRERKQSLAIKKLEKLGSSKNMVAITTLEEFRSDFIAYAKMVYAPESIGIYERSFKKLIESDSPEAWSQEISTCR